MACNLVQSDENLVFIREVTPQECGVEEFEGVDKAYGVFSAAGKRLALAADRKLAFALARNNDLQPVSVH